MSEFKVCYLMLSLLGLKVVEDIRWHDKKTKGIGSHTCLNSRFDIWRCHSWVWVLSFLGLSGVKDIKWHNKKTKGIGYHACLNSSLITTCFFYWIWGLYRVSSDTVKKKLLIWLILLDLSSIKGIWWQNKKTEGIGYHAILKYRLFIWLILLDLSSVQVRWWHKKKWKRSIPFITELKVIQQHIKGAPTATCSLKELDFQFKTSRGEVIPLHGVNVSFSLFFSRAQPDA